MFLIVWSVTLHGAVSARFPPQTKFLTSVGLTWLETGDIKYCINKLTDDYCSVVSGVVSVPGNNFTFTVKHRLTSTCLSVCLSPFTCLSVSVYLSVRLSLFTCPSVSVYLSVCLRLPVCLSLTFHLSEHFLENSAKLTDCSGFFFRCSSLHVWTKKAYADVFPFGLLTSLRIILAAWQTDGYRLTIRIMFSSDITG